MERQPLVSRMREWFLGEPRPAPTPAASTVGASSRAPRPSVEGSGSAIEKQAYLARVEEAVDLVERGRKLLATVVSRETSDRRFNGAQIIVVELEFEDPAAPDSPRSVLYDHVFGPASARSWKPGREIPIWIDPRDPERIYAGR